MGNERTGSTPYSIVDLVVYLVVGCFAGAAMAFTWASSSSSRSVPLWTGLGAAGGFLLSAFDAIRRFKRGRGFEAEATRQGAEYSPGAPAEVLAMLRSDFPRLRLGMGNVLRKQVADLDFVVGDLSITIEVGIGDRERDKTVAQTAAYFRIPNAAVPGFALQPANPMTKLFVDIAGVEEVKFPDMPEFSQIYFLSAVRPSHVRALFNPQVRSWLMAHPGLHLESSDAALLVYRKGQVVPVADIDAFIGEAAELFRLLGQAQGEARAKIAAMPKEDARDAAAKIPGLLGRTIRERLVTREDVDAFVRQPAPRQLPPHIGKYVAEQASILALSMTVLFALLGVGAIASGGMKREWGTAAVGLLFVGIGSALTYLVASARWRTVRLMRYGALTVANIEKIDVSGTVSLHYYAGDQRQQATHTIDGDALVRTKRLLAQGKQARILYDPANATRLVLVDELLKVSPEFDS